MSNTGKASVSILVLLFVAGLLVSGIFGFIILNQQQTTYNGKIKTLQNQVSTLQGFQNTTSQIINIYQNGTSLSDLYQNVKDSIVLIQGTTSTETVQGSGFVYDFSGRMVIVTNYHVVAGVESGTLSVTFPNGNGYGATVLGSDPYSDLAILNVNAQQSEFKPLQIVSSSSISVGDTVIAIGNPYGLICSMTTGIVSQLGRTLPETETIGHYSIANVIQTSAPINPGNSGGPLLNADGKVIGITAAVVSDSQGLGLAIPSNAILREVSALVNTGSYSGHTYLGVSGQSDMSYDVAKQLGVNVTYGWLIDTVTSGGPSANILQNGDIIIALNHNKIINHDALAAYLEENNLPGQSLVVTVIRNNSQLDETVVLGTRPAP
jgi:S1-C subfamily serine protease